MGFNIAGNSYSMNGLALESFKEENNLGVVIHRTGAPSRQYPKR
jgi:hypothetical protein